MWEEGRESAGVVSTVSYSLLHSVPHSFNKFEQGERFLVCMCVCVCVILLSVSVLNEGRERKRDDEANHGVILCAC